MSLMGWGALLGLGAGVGVVLVAHTLTTRPSSIELRVLPYLRDLPAVETSWSPASVRPRSVTGALLGPVLSWTAHTLDRVLGGSTSVRRRLERAGLEATVWDHRVQQAVWGMAAFGAVAALAVPVSLRSPERSVPLLLMCLFAFVAAALVRDHRLTVQAAARERRMLAEFPAVAELLALAVAAGEGPVAALDRVVGRARGDLATELARVLAQVRTGTPMTSALDALAARTAVPAVARFAEALAVALERGTPLAEVMHAQAADVREAGRRALIESGARKEVQMMVPVVFLVLPVTVVFAFWPGVVGLRLVAP